MMRALAVSALLALMGVPSITRAPRIRLFAFTSLHTAERMMAFSYRAPVKNRSGEWIEGATALHRFEATSLGRAPRGAGRVNPRSVTAVGFLLAEKTPGSFALEVAWVKVL